MVQKNPLDKFQGHNEMRDVTQFFDWLLF